MKCSACGADAPDGMRFCAMCGKALVQPPVSQGPVRNRICVGCGRTLSWDANVCQYCGHDFRERSADSSRDHLVIGGALTLLAGILSIALTTIMLGNMDRIDSSQWSLAALVYCCAIVGILGGLLALARTSFPFAVFGAACSVIGPGFFFGIPGLVLIAKSSRAFAPRPPQNM